jgi:predicted CXXCH cytochrome family protein
MIAILIPPRCRTWGDWNTLPPYGWLELETRRIYLCRRSVRQAIGTGRPYQYEQQNASFEWCFRMMTSAANPDTDLSNDRPLSTPYHENAGSHAIARGNYPVGHPPRFDSILPFFSSRVECAICHDSHNTSSGNTTMVRQLLAGPALCLHCYNK